MRTVRALKRQFKHVESLEKFLRRFQIDPDETIAELDPSDRPLLSELLRIIVCFNHQELEDVPSTESYYSFINRVIQNLPATVIIRQRSRMCHSKVINILYSPAFVLLDRLVGRKITQFLILNATLMVPQVNTKDAWLQLTGKPIVQSNPSSRRLVAKAHNANGELNKTALFLNNIDRPKLYVLPQTHLNVVFPLEYHQPFPNVTFYPASHSVKTVPRLKKISQLLQDARDRFGEDKIKKILRKHCDLGRLGAVPKHAVSKFVVSAIKSTFSYKLFGSQDNWRSFEALVKKFIQMDPKETPSLDDLIRKLKTKQIEWLIPECSPDSHTKNRSLLLQFMHWLLKTVVLKVLLSVFCLRTATDRSVMYFYRNTWNRIQRAQQSDLADSLEELFPNHQETSMDLWMEPARSFVFPKSSGDSFRNIINLKHIAKDLVPIKPVLENLVGRHTDIPYMRQFTDVYPLVDGFLKEYNENTSFYIVRADIKNCFDSANTQKIKEIVDRELAPHVAFVVRKIRRVVRGRLVERFTAASTSDQWEWNTPVVTDQRQAPEIVTETSDIRLISTEQVKGSVANVLDRLLVKARGRTMRKTSGLPQGSQISIPLCDLLCLDFIHNELEEFYGTKHCLLLRYVDDFLLISAEKSTAEEFVRKINQGFPEYGIFFNSDKLITNFVTGLGGTYQEHIKYLGTYLRAVNRQVSFWPTIKLNQRLCSPIKMVPEFYLRTKYICVCMRKFSPKSPASWKYTENVVLGFTKQVSLKLLNANVSFVDARFIIFHVLRHLLKAIGSRVPNIMRRAMTQWIQVYKGRTIQRGSVKLLRR